MEMDRVHEVIAALEASARRAKEDYEYILSLRHEFRKQPALPEAEHAAIYNACAAFQSWLAVKGMACLELQSILSDNYCRSHVKPQASRPVQAQNLATMVKKLSPEQLESLRQALKIRQMREALKK